MNAAMVSRGPDEVRAFTDCLSRVSLGARRLRVIDVRGGRQPVANEEGTLWAALDGEVFNHPELRETLRRRGHRFASSVDTEVLVHLYEEHGSVMVDLPEGMRDDRDQLGLHHARGRRMSGRLPPFVRAS
jgi:asparagine synthase (glutamine-hydrolysing)